MILNLTKAELECLRRCVLKQRGVVGDAAWCCQPLVDALTAKIESLQATLKKAGGR